VPVSEARITVLSLVVVKVEVAEFRVEVETSEKSVCEKIISVEVAVEVEVKISID